MLIAAYIPTVEPSLELDIRDTYTYSPFEFRHLLYRWIMNVT